MTSGSARRAPLRTSTQAARSDPARSPQDGWLPARMDSTEAAAQGVKAVLDQEGLAVREEGAGFGVEAEHDLDGAQDDLLAAFGQIEDLGERVERIALMADVHGEPLSHDSLAYL